MTDVRSPRNAERKHRGETARSARSDDRCGAESHRAPLTGVTAERASHGGRTVGGRKQGENTGGDEGKKKALGH